MLPLAAAAPAPERTPRTPPAIGPVAAGTVRPQWSVMIPAYNCAAYLEQTLRSVLAQDLGPAQMQVVVVDDHSTDADLAALVARVGQGRVGYYRQPRNVGSLRNFETCLNLATGHWVHLLHGDDRVAPGFYDQVARLFAQYPEAGAAFTNTADLTDGPAGEELTERPPIRPTAGLLPELLLRQAERQQLETPSIVVKRAVYEQLGGFYAVHYGEDWEMWARIAAHFPVAYSPRCLAHYRYLNATSISHRSVRTGQNLRDIALVIELMQAYLPAGQRRRLRRRARRHYATYCAGLAFALYAENDPAALVQAGGALGMSRHFRVVYLALKLYGRYLLRWLMRPLQAHGAVDPPAPAH